MNLMKGDKLNICATLLFAKNPQFKLPAFIVKAVAYQGNDFTEQNYRDNRNIQGKLADVFQQSLSFLLSNIQHQQNEQGFNSVGQPEIPRIVLEELIANALIHRDYFISAPIRLFVFQNRIEIISPGHLPNNLTIENIKYGNSNARNPILASFARLLLPYSGIGSGIMRALQHYPEIDFIDDRKNNQFKVVIHRTMV
jgi:ATP-dependent DNA helicase RecG